MTLINKEKLINEIKYNFSENETYSMKTFINAIEDYTREDEKMTVEDKCRVLKDLLAWADTTKEQYLYMEERVYAVRTDIGVMILKADNPQQALDVVGRGE